MAIHSPKGYKHRYRPGNRRSSKVSENPKIDLPKPVPDAVSRYAVACCLQEDSIQSMQGYAGLVAGSLRSRFSLEAAKRSRTDGFVYARPLGGVPRMVILPFGLVARMIESNPVIDSNPEFFKEEPDTGVDSEQASNFRQDILNKLQGKQDLEADEFSLSGLQIVRTKKDSFRVNALPDVSTVNSKHKNVQGNFPKYLGGILKVLLQYDIPEAEGLIRPYIPIVDFQINRKPPRNRQKEKKLVAEDIQEHLDSLDLVKYAGNPASSLRFTNPILTSQSGKAISPDRVH